MILMFGMLVMSIATPARSAWSEDAHRIICEIAWLELTPHAREEIRELLSADAEYYTFADSCVWADRIRGRGRYPEYRTAHYMNVPPGSRGVDIARDCADAICVLEAIDAFAGDLRDTAQSSRRLVALKFLSHFVADLHQPLHVGYAADRGGNERRVRLAGRQYNLHELWDHVLVGPSASRWTDRAADMHGSIDPIDRVIWVSNDPIRWANESFQIVENEVYADLTSDIVGEAYILLHSRTAETRMIQAGLRLGRMLNDLLDS